jgi:hypothetical protein
MKGDLYFKNRERKKCKKLRDCLQFVSVGKFQTKLYHKGEEELSSSFGGIITILVAIIIVVFAILSIMHVISKNEYILIQ